MPETFKILGQVIPAANTEGVLYTVPAARSAVISTITLCNDGPATTVSVRVRPAGAAVAAVHNIAASMPIAASETITLTLGITLAATDVISVRAATGNVAAHAYGSEIT